MAVFAAIGAGAAVASAGGGIAGAFKGDPPRFQELYNQIQGAFAMETAMRLETEADLIVAGANIENERAARRNALISRANALASADALEATARNEAETAYAALRQGEEESTAIRQDGARIIAAQQIGLAANGISVSGEDAIFLMKTTKALVEDDAEAARQEATDLANNFMQRARNANTDAANQRRQGDAFLETSEIARRNTEAALATLPIIDNAGNERRRATLFGVAAAGSAPTGTSTTQALSGAFASIASAATTVYNFRS